MQGRLAFSGRERGHALQTNARETTRQLNHGVIVAAVHLTTDARAGLLPAGARLSTAVGVTARCWDREPAKGQGLHLLAGLIQPLIEQRHGLCFGAGFCLESEGEAKPLTAGGAGLVHLDLQQGALAGALGRLQGCSTHSHHTYREGNHQQSSPSIPR